MTPSDRRGLALPAAVFCLAIIALFVAGSSFAASQEARASTGTLAQRVAIEAAEYGLTSVLRDWSPEWNTSIPVGQTLGPFTHNVTSVASAIVHVTRTSLTTWWVVSSSTVGTGATREARRAINAILRPDLSTAPPGAALAVTDSASVTGTGRVIGTDSLEAAGVCGSLTSPAMAGVAAPDTTRISGLPGIIGTPPLATDSAVHATIAAIDSTLTADIIVPAGSVITPLPALVGAACDTAAATNWGDPDGGACRHHFPIIKALGDIVVRGGKGQGILIAAGDVRFENGAVFAGIVTARDDFVTGSGGGTVLGAVLAGDLRRGGGDHSVVGSGSLVRRSSCRVLQARLGAASPRRIRERWWAELD